MWAMSITGHSISQWLPCPVPSWVPNTVGTWGGNSVKKKKKMHLTSCRPFCCSRRLSDAAPTHPACHGTRAGETLTRHPGGSTAAACARDSVLPSGRVARTSDATWHSAKRRCSRRKRDGSHGGQQVATVSTQSDGYGGLLLVLHLQIIYDSTFYVLYHHFNESSINLCIREQMYTERQAEEEDRD